MEIEVIEKRNTAILGNFLGIENNSYLQKPKEGRNEAYLEERKNRKH